MRAILKHMRTVLLLSSAIAVGQFAAADELNPAVAAAQQARIAAIKKCVESTVCVFDQAGKGGGSGVVVSPDGYALTNFHVASPSGSHMLCGMSDGKLYDAVIVGSDPVGDVALIKLLGREDFPTAELGDSDKVQVGDWCVVVGNPFLLATDLQPTVSYGIVSGTHRYQYPAGTLLEYADCIQTDAAINPGNSGGPLFNARGQLIGINGRGSFEKRGRVNVGVGYAISINQIKNFMGYLRSGRIVDHATLGANVSSDNEGRVVVSNILDSSDAYRRGLRYGDEIISFGGRSIDTVNAFKNALGIYPKGFRIPLSYLRNGQQYNVFVRLTGVHSREELIEKVTKQAVEPPSPKQKPGEPDEPKKPALPMPQMHAKPKTPEHVAKFIQEKRGYSNHYFNKLNLDRVWKSSGFADNPSAKSDWQLTGTIDGGDRVQINLGDSLAMGEFPTGPAKLDVTADLDNQRGPRGSGGLLTALWLWKRLQSQGPEKFGEVFYLGTLPIPGDAAHLDVLSATHRVVQARFFFSTETGKLRLIEMYPDSDVDPCEVYFSDYRDLNGASFPHRLSVKYGDNNYGSITVDSFVTKSNEEAGT